MNDPFPPRQRSFLEIFRLRKPTEEELEDDRQVAENPAPRGPAAGPMTPGCLFVVIVVAILVAFALIRAASGV